MQLTSNQKENISKFIPVFQSYLKRTDRIDDLNNRQERTQLYERILSSQGIEQMTELEFGKLISSLWAFTMWGNKSYLVDKLLTDNKLDDLKRKLNGLLWGEKDLQTRFNEFRECTSGFGPASITEILSFTHPEECGLWNTKARKALQKLGFSDTLSFLKKNEIDGEQYSDFNKVLIAIEEDIRENYEIDLDLLGVDYFLFEVWGSDLDFQDNNVEIIIEEGETETIVDFDHSEAIEMLLTIGQWLGFEVEKEKTIATGARVDVIWQARVANLGVVTYVFEVQRRGSIDSLILNLQRAQNNPTVQRLIVVAMSKELENIQKEINTLREDFRRMVGYMDVAELIKATDLVAELSGIINKLELVKSEFDI